VVNNLSRQLESAANSVKRLGTRTRAMNRKLINVERLPEAAAQTLLADIEPVEDPEDEGEAA
jgi:DNA anti-recombination protein RmuC